MEDERRKQTEQKLLASYFSFESKETLLSAILEPVIADYQHMMRELAQREIDDPDTGDDNERQIEQQMQAAFTGFFSKYMDASPDKKLIEILVSMRLQGYLELIKGDYTVEERVQLAREIGVHADAGTAALIKYLNEQKEVYRR